VHGKLKEPLKQNTLQDFKDLTTGGILVATTVIEVGIDIPYNDTMGFKALFPNSNPLLLFFNLCYFLRNRHTKASHFI
jgi:hypothetical protein